ncbi:hypothetical protein LY76DRAFT_586411 [Colletotrichum caudatum]|nr:hypothetical protein LY76DRAFT_586411 [Colletotrichum caudatum]
MRLWLFGPMLPVGIRYACSSNEKPDVETMHPAQVAIAIQTSSHLTLFACCGGAILHLLPSTGSALPADVYCSPGW